MWKDISQLDIITSGSAAAVDEDLSVSGEDAEERGHSLVSTVFSHVASPHARVDVQGPVPEVLLSLIPNVASIIGEDVEGCLLYLVEVTEEDQSARAAVVVDAGARTIRRVFDGAALGSALLKTASRCV